MIPNPFAIIGRTFQRKRHARGFGVHSPFAYRFVTDVIHPGRYGYYAFDEIDDDTALSPKVCRDAKWYVRIARFLESQRFVTPGDIPTGARRAAKALGVDVISAKEGRWKDSDILIVNGEDGSYKLIKGALEAGIPVLAIQPDTRLRRRLEEPIAKGLALYSKNKILIVPRDAMAFTSYQIDF